MLCSLPLPSLSSSLDNFFWLAGEHELGNYSAASTWEALRNRGHSDGWEKLVWFKGHIPSHAFMLWVAHLDRLPTRERLVS